MVKNNCRVSCGCLSAFFWIVRNKIVAWTDWFLFLYRCAVFVGCLYLYGRVSLSASICGHIYLCPRLSEPAFIWARVYLCPRLSVPASICARVYLCPRLSVPAPRRGVYRGVRPPYVEVWGRSPQALRIPKKKTSYIFFVNLIEKHTEY
jgi:hypothetical protein